MTLQAESPRPPRPEEECTPTPNSRGKHLNFRGGVRLEPLLIRSEIPTALEFLDPGILIMVVPQRGIRKGESNHEIVTSKQLGSHLKVAFVRSSFSDPPSGDGESREFLLRESGIAGCLASLLIFSVDFSNCANIRPQVTIVILRGCR